MDNHDDRIYDIKTDIEKEMYVALQVMFPPEMQDLVVEYAGGPNVYHLKEPTHRHVLLIIKWLHQIPDWEFLEKTAFQPIRKVMSTNFNVFCFYKQFPKDEKKMVYFIELVQGQIEYRSLHEFFDDRVVRLTHKFPNAAVRLLATSLAFEARLISINELEHDPAEKIKEKLLESANPPGLRLEKHFVYKSLLVSS